MITHRLGFLGLMGSVEPPKTDLITDEIKNVSSIIDNLPVPTKAALSIAALVYGMKFIRKMLPKPSFKYMLLKPAHRRRFKGKRGNQ